MVLILFYGGGSSGLPHISFSSSIKLTANDRVRINANKGYVFTGSVANKYVPALTGHFNRIKEINMASISEALIALNITRMDNDW